MAKRLKGKASSVVAGIVLTFILVVTLWLMFQVVTGVIKVLYFIAPLLIILTLILNYRVVLNYGKWLIGKIREDTASGIMYGILSIIGYPFLFAYLLSQAFLGRKNKSEPAEGEYIKYEEIEESEFLELPQLEELKKETDQNQYEDLF